MYYILNEANHIIAADSELLSFCGVSQIDELYLAVGLEKIHFTPAPQNKLIIKNEGDETLFPSHQTSLSSMLGHLTLVNLEEKNHSQVKESILDQEIKEEKLIKSEDTFDSLDLFDSPATITVETSVKEEPVLTKEEGITFDIMNEPLQDTVDNSLEETPSLVIEEIKEKDTTPISINIAEVSEKIGVSTEDYKAFYDEYLDTANTLKSDLKGEDTAKRSTAITTLSHLGYMLYLPEVGDILTHLGEVNNEEAQTEIIHFYDTISRIKLVEEIKETPKAKIEEVIQAPIKKEKPIVKGFGTINLENVKPIHFDFQLEQAANDLSLPVELIEEFVNDFIDQAHIETVKMLQAYEEGNLDTIQKIGHLLKGASSNLRIVPLSDTLYQIQFCEDPKLLEGYILDYWGHFIAFETKIKMISN